MWDQEYKIPAKRVLMNKYWKRCDGSLGALLIEMGKNKATKDSKKLSASVNKIKQKYDSLRQASRVANIPWTKFHRSKFVQKKIESKGKFTHKSSSKEVSDVQSHFESDDISFPLPDKKFEGKRFMRQSVKKSVRMYNDLATTSRKISLSTYYRYKPKNVKFPGKIPFQQSCCEKCKNAENIIDEAGKYMRNVPCDLGGCVDRTLCPYKGYFPKIECILHKCNTCGTAKFHREILNDNKDKTKDKRQRFLVKLWYTKREKKKDGTTQSFLHWKFE